MAFYKILEDSIVMDDATFAGSTSATEQAIFNQAVASGLPLHVRPGVYTFGNVSVSGPIEVKAVEGKVVFRLATNTTGIVYLGAFTKARFEGIEFDGNNVAFAPDGNLVDQGLVNMMRNSGTLVSTAKFINCTFRRSTRSGVTSNECRLHVECCSFESCALKSVSVVGSDEVVVDRCRFENQGHAIHCSPNAVSNVRVTDNVILKCSRNGIAIEPGGSAKIATNVVIRGNRIGKLNAGDSWGVARTDTATTGSEGNGILVYLTDQAVIEGNIVADCQFSAIRTNVSSRLTITGNVCRGSGETALYVETVGIDVGEFGATVSGNSVYGGGAGISVVNFDYQGRFAAVNGNIVWDISNRTITYSGGSYITGGTGIYVEGDVSVSGNTVQNCYFGLALGTGTFQSDLIAAGNVIRQTTLGIGVPAAPPKDILISGNLIVGFSSGAIKSFSYSQNQQLIIQGPELSPANRGSSVTNTNVHMVGNVRRASL